MTPSNQPGLSISAVERETGLSKDVLRKWESRYGFPAPLRDANGERAYPAEQVSRLRLIKRLMDAGMRPAKLVGRTAEELLAVAAPPLGPAMAPPPDDLTGEALARLKAHDLTGLRRLLGRQLQQSGLRGFVQDILTPLSRAVGEAWARGQLEIHEEHLYTEIIQGLLRAALDPVNDPDGHPRMLLATLPDEAHSLGLLMVAGVFALGGAHCISLGSQTPVQEVANGARAHRVDVVVLSFSPAYPQRRILPALAELRQRLPEHVALWAGGSGTLRLARPGSGIRLTPGLEDAEGALGAWQAAHPRP